MRNKINILLNRIQWNMFNLGLDKVGNSIQDLRMIILKGDII